MAPRNDPPPRTVSPVPAGGPSDLFTTAPLPVAPLDDAQRLACLRLIRSENVGPVTFRELINHYGGATAALEALPEISRRSGRGRTITICPRDRALAELEAAGRMGATPVFTIEPNYPHALAQLAVPPPLLYVKGRLPLLQRPVVALVGARNGSAAGTRLTRQFASRLGEAGYVVASGLARGIDAAAHEASFPTGTIAVLAGGIDFIYPPENADLHARIGESGCLVTEMPPGFHPRAQDFPRRNRIVSGLSLAVVIVEAAHRSGSLITARTANEQGRVVMAVPGHPLDPRAEGPNGLIKEGAIMVTSVEDILDVLAPMTRRPPGAPGAQAAFEEVAASSPARSPPPPPPSPPSHPEAVPANASQAVLDVLGPTPVTVDEVARASNVPIHLVKIAVLELSLAGLVERHGGQLVSLKSE